MPTNLVYEEAFSSITCAGSLHPVDASNAEHAARDTDCAAHDPSASTTAAATAAAGDVGDPPEGSADDRDNSKACLQRYRKVSCTQQQLMHGYTSLTEPVDIIDGAVDLSFHQEVLNTYRPFDKQ